MFLPLNPLYRGLVFDIVNPCRRDAPALLKRDGGADATRGVAVGVADPNYAECDSFKFRVFAFDPPWRFVRLPTAFGASLLLRLAWGPSLDFNTGGQRAGCEEERKDDGPSASSGQGTRVPFVFFAALWCETSSCPPAGHGVHRSVSHCPLGAGARGPER